MFKKGNYLLFIFMAFLTLGASIDLGDTSLFKTFQESMRELTAASRRVSQLVGAEREASREELEADREPGSEQDASQESDEEIEEDGGDVGSVLMGIPEFFKILRSPARGSWWTGPNVCASRETKEEKSEEGKGFAGDGIFILGSAQFSSCKQTQQKHICTTVTHKNGVTKTASVTYQCCHGFRRVNANPGCTKVETKPILEMASDLGASRFSAIVSSLGMEELLEKGNTTVVMPTDEAFADFQGMTSVNQIETHNRETNDVNEVLAKSETASRDLVLNHILATLLDTSDFHNDMIVKTEGNATLRINIFPGESGPIVTVNCSPLNATDKMTDSGMVHTVNRVLEPVRRTLLDILSDPEYSQFAQLLKENELLKELEGEGPYTVFALTNDAMNKLESKSMCMKRILKHHILPHTVCSEAASSGRISAMDLASHWVQLSKDEDSSLLLDGTVQITKADILATNGIVHRVESLAVPSTAKSLREMLSRNNRTLFLDLLEKTGVLSDIEKSKDKVTVFLPTEASIKESSQMLESLDPEALKALVAYHIAVDPKSEEGCELKEGILTMDTKAEGKPIIVKAYSKMSQILSGLVGVNQVATAGCSRLTGAQGKVCNGAVREVLSVIAPPNGTLYTQITDREEFNAFSELLKGTKLESELKSGLDKLITVLIPTAEALKRMGDGNYETLLKDKPLADQILRAHILSEPVCCGSVSYSSWPFTTSVRTMSGGAVETMRRGRDAVAFGGVPVKQCDYLATDGVIHLLSGVLLPAGQRRNTDIIYRNQNSEIVLTGF